MNQILTTDSYKKEKSNKFNIQSDLDTHDVLKLQEIASENTKKTSKHHSFKVQIIFSFLVIIISVSAYFTLSWYNTKNENLSTKLKNNFNISTLYSNSSEHSIRTVSINNTSYGIIGIIKIEKLKIDYPIFSETTDELLKIAPCRFDGPMPNEIGNLCIAGHNYDNNKFFSKIHELQAGDTIFIYDSSGSVVEYSVYNNYEVDYNDTSSTSQQTNGSKEITLISCNNYNSKRVIIKAKEK